MDVKFSPQQGRIQGVAHCLPTYLDPPTDVILLFLFAAPRQAVARSPHSTKWVLVVTYCLGTMSCPASGAGRAGPFSLALWCGCCYDPLLRPMDDYGRTDFLKTPTVIMWSKFCADSALNKEKPKFKSVVRAGAYAALTLLKSVVLCFCYSSVVFCPVPHPR